MVAPPDVRASRRRPASAITPDLSPVVLRRGHIILLGLDLGSRKVGNKPRNDTAFAPGIASLNIARLLGPLPWLNRIDGRRRHRCRPDTGDRRCGILPHRLDLVGAQIMVEADLTKIEKGNIGKGGLAVVAAWAQMPSLVPIPAE